MSTEAEVEIALVGLDPDEVLEVVRIIESGKDTPPNMTNEKDKDREDPPPSPLDPQDDPPPPGGGDTPGPGKKP